MSVAEFHTAVSWKCGNRTLRLLDSSPTRFHLGLVHTLTQLGYTQLCRMCDHYWYGSRMNSRMSVLTVTLSGEYSRWSVQDADELSSGRRVYNPEMRKAPALPVEVPQPSQAHLPSAAPKNLRRASTPFIHLVVYGLFCPMKAEQFVQTDDMASKNTIQYNTILFYWKSCQDAA